MATINILDQNTINQIAAGEVIERPASVVKELIENSIDAGATAITCEIKGGGIELIRVTDNGSGIEPSQIRKAFTAHATSKIKTAADLTDINSLGFRGEALASIASVAEAEVLTKQKGEVMGIRYLIKCGTEQAFTDAGCPEGTTIIVKQLFANVPVRKKFLKSAITEASYVSDLVEKIALSHPEVSIKYINNSKTVLFTTGNGKTEDVIYSIFGRDITSSLIEVKHNCTKSGNSQDISNDVSGNSGDKSSDTGNSGNISLDDSGITIEGFVAKPIVTRSNRGMEHYFVNGRYIRNNIISKAIEEAYAPYMMQHRYPFTVLNLNIDTEKVDVNVHPSKQEIRFEQPQDVFNAVYKAISTALRKALMIPDAGNDSVDTKADARMRTIENVSIQKAAEPFERKTNDNISGQNNIFSQNTGFGQNTNAVMYENTEEKVIPGNSFKNDIKLESPEDFRKDFTVQNDLSGNHSNLTDFTSYVNEEPPQNKYTATQLVFETGNTNEINTIRPETSEEFRKGLNEGYRIIGQVFATYWIVERGNTMYMIDQHAAHEKIIYERICNHNSETAFDTQMLKPSLILSFTPSECACIEEHIEDFRSMGFELEYFSGNEYHLSGVPLMLYSLEPKELIHEIVDSYLSVNAGASDGLLKNVSHSEILQNRLATCACKAAVKGNTRISQEEARKLIEDLLKLDNPFNCPHGRPIIIEMTKQELEKKFKRIV